MPTGFIFWDELSHFFSFREQTICNRIIKFSSFCSMTNAQYRWFWMEPRSQNPFTGWKHGDLDSVWPRNWQIGYSKCNIFRQKVGKIENLPLTEINETYLRLCYWQIGIKYNYLPISENEIEGFGQISAQTKAKC